MFSLNENREVKFITALLFVLFALLWILAFLTLWSLYKNYKRSLKLNRRIQTNIAPEKQMSIVLICMVVAFTLSLLPTLYNHIQFYILGGENFEDNKRESVAKFFIAFLFLLTNSIWNILIYNILNKQFRSALVALLKKPCKCILPK